jgi:hypothetical protein
MRVYKFRKLRNFVFKILIILIVAKLNTFRIFISYKLRLKL